MKRRTVTLIAFASLLLPAAAIAGLADWNGNFEGGGFMSFDEKNGGKTAKDFDWSDVPIDCDTPFEPIAGELSKGMEIKHKRFKGTDHEDGYTEKVKGRFVSKHEAKGSLRVKGEINGADCDTGKRRWEAGDL